MREVNFDGLVGPTHNYAGLSRGNLASVGHGGQLSWPREAALQGLAKMRHLMTLGLAQGVLPPQQRPHVPTLRRLGFVGSDAEVVSSAARCAPQLLSRCCSASAMWTANAATVTPSADTQDGRVHLTPANLSSMFHRAIEAPSTYRVLSRVFGDSAHFVVHEPLPAFAGLGDEGAANHSRLATDRGVVHLFGWGRSSVHVTAIPTRHPARQCLEASEAVARMHGARPDIPLFWRQAPEGIDAGAFHSDVLAVGNENFLMLHEWAFSNTHELLDELTRRLGPSFCYVLASNDELPAPNAVGAYPFNSQVVTLPSGSMRIIAPLETRADDDARRFIERVLAEDNPVDSVDYLDVRQSMSNGGGPACLRLRVPLTQDESGALGGRAVLDDALCDELVDWVERHYRQELAPADLADPQLLQESYTALDELTQLLQLGSVYEFQR